MIPTFRLWYINKISYYNSVLISSFT